jgi:hypothetical protein
MSPRAIQESSVFVAARDVLASEFGSEYVLLNLNNGTYYGLEGVGGVIWKMLQAPVSVADLCRSVTETFAVDSETCLRDVTNLLDELVASGLVEVTRQSYEHMGDDS